MQFTISRTSEWLDNKQPCEEAVRQTRPFWEVRSCSEDEYNKRNALMGKPWRKEGTNHYMTEEGYIKRQRGIEIYWTIDISDIYQLIVLSEKYGKLIIGKKTIEIYDDRRE